MFSNNRRKGHGEFQSIDGSVYTGPYKRGLWNTSPQGWRRILTQETFLMTNWETLLSTFGPNIVQVPSSSGSTRRAASVTTKIKDANKGSCVVKGICRSNEFSG